MFDQKWSTTFSFQLFQDFLGPNERSSSALDNHKRIFEIPSVSKKLLICNFWVIFDKFSSQFSSIFSWNWATTWHSGNFHGRPSSKNNFSFLAFHWWNNFLKTLIPGKVMNFWKLSDFWAHFQFLHPKNQCFFLI